MSDPEGKVLIADDEELLTASLGELIRREGLTPFLAHDGPAAVEMLRSVQPDVLLVDYTLPGMNGMEVMRAAKAFDGDLPVILITGFADVHGAVDAMRAGADDYLAKPFRNDELLRAVLRALKERHLKRRLKLLSQHIRPTGALQETMGPSETIASLIAEVEQVAKSDFGVLITGETGSGKELVARAIHQRSGRSTGPFIPLDCGAIPETLFESELFGHEKGSYTGAHVQKPGLIEVASGGTLFLDEVANLSLASQAKLLRVLQERTVTRVGGTKPVQVDMRVIAATNHDLREMVRSGAFRHDLYFRLNEYSLHVVALRERKDDIPYLANRFMEITNMELGKAVRGVLPQTMERLMAHNWPGNVRELRSVIRRGVLLADQYISEQHFDLGSRSAVSTSSTSRTRRADYLPECGPAGLSLRLIVRHHTALVEREVLTRTLQQADGNKAKAARMLQIDYKTMHSKLKEYGLGHAETQHP